MKIALVHDYLREYGGAERVLEALHDVYPDAPIYTAFVDKNSLGIHWERFKNWNIQETWITKLPWYKKLHSPYRVFAPSAFKDLDLSQYDIVISSSNAYYAKAVSVPHGKHICYCHTPPRALYGYATMTDWKQNPITRVVGTIINHYLRVVDFQMAQKVDYFIANSQEVAKRIKKFYRRDATVIFPPVDVAGTAKDVAHKKGKYYLYVNRLALAKHPEIAVAACRELNLPLKVVGDGKLREALEQQAGETVEFLGAVSDEQLHQLYSEAIALLYPVEDEDFGIVPIEAMGHGVPVIAHNSGGPKETILNKKTGLLFSELSEAGLVAAIKDSQLLKFDHGKIKEHAVAFKKEVFMQKIKNFVEKISSKK